jgi:hypothetical protein
MTKEDEYAMKMKLLVLTHGLKHGCDFERVAMIMIDHMARFISKNDLEGDMEEYTTEMVVDMVSNIEGKNNE